MSGEKPDGGPAFPGKIEVGKSAVNDTNYEYPHGMSLRDWFAGQALAGWGAGKRTSLDQHQPEYIAASCYTLADAMLKARDA